MDKVSMMIKARRLVKDVDDLPAIPAIVSKVVSMLEDVDADSDAIADLMLSDQVLAARVIRVVNSPLYRSSSEITSVKRALLFLGFKSVREMLLTSYFVGAFKGRKEPFDIKTFWLHSFSVGLISQRIAGMVGYRDGEKANLVGIIHDIGKVFLGHYFQDEYAGMLEMISGKPYTTYEAEVEVFGTSHCEVGLCLAQRWNFPPAYCDIISYHHSSELATEDPLLTAIVSLADFFSLASTPASGVAQAHLPGRSEENAWKVLKQLSSKPLATELSGFLDELAVEFAKAPRQVDILFHSMVSA
jgi:putative nucleotidyltransferase with HDIG domain